MLSRDFCVVVINYKNRHFSHRVGWLRAAVLGANDGIVSTASLLIGVASASAGSSAVLLAGVAGMVAGAMSMAAGEYVSVSSQADCEKADLELERYHLRRDIEFERRELAQIYEQRGLDRSLAREVALQLMRHNALEAHARDELGIHVRNQARPLQAAFSSAAAFVLGAILPILTAMFSPHAHLVIVIAITALAALAGLGVVAALAGGARMFPSVVRVVVWGALAMVASAATGHLFGISMM